MDERPIINADDLGLSAEVNQAIVISFRNAWINSASLMANTPGFDEACASVRMESSVLQFFRAKFPAGQDGLSRKNNGTEV